MNSVDSSSSLSPLNGHSGKSFDGGHSSRVPLPDLGPVGGLDPLVPSLNSGAIPVVGTGTDINKTINNLIDGAISINEFKSFVDAFSGPAPQKQVLQDFLLMYDPANQEFLNSEIDAYKQDDGSQSSDSSSMYVLDQLITYNRLEQEHKKPAPDRVGFNQDTYDKLQTTLKNSLETLKTQNNRPMLCSACLYLGDDAVSDPVQKINNGYSKIVPDVGSALDDEFVSDGLTQLKTLREPAYADSSFRSGFDNDVVEEEDWETTSNISDLTDSRDEISEYESDDDWVDRSGGAGFGGQRGSSSDVSAPMSICLSNDDTPAFGPSVRRPDKYSSFAGGGPELGNLSRGHYSVIPAQRGVHEKPLDSGRVSGANTYNPLRDANLHGRRDRIGDGSKHKFKHSNLFTLDNLF